MPSVEPHVTVISVSGSMSSPRYHLVFRAMASRKSRAPQVIAYWLTSSAIACMATRLMSSGAAKSGKPCERLTAPCLIASRVISRITDSVNEFALLETRWRVESAGVVIILTFSLAACIRARHHRAEALLVFLRRDERTHHRMLNVQVADREGVHLAQPEFKSIDVGVAPQVTSVFSEHEGT